MNDTHVQARAVLEEGKVMEDEAADLHRRAVRHFTEKRPHLALELLHSALSRRETATWWNDLGTIELCVGNVAVAEEAFRRTLQMEPAHQLASANLIALLECMGKMREAEAIRPRPPEALIASQRPAAAALTLNARQQAASESGALAKQIEMFRRDMQKMHHDLLCWRNVHENQDLVTRELLRTTLLSHPKYRDPKRLQSYEVQCCSQSGEDGILAEIFHRIGVGSRVFAEFGVEDGLENNTAYLLLQGWRGFWFECNAGSMQRLRKNASRQIASGQLVAAPELMTAENAAQVFQRWNVPRDLDLLSLDIDRNTPAVWRALSDWRPRVAVVEYNPAFAPSDAWEVPYDPALSWDGTVFFGASLLRLEEIGSELGYCLVGCNLAGVNAFFVREDLVEDRFCAPFTAANHFEPARFRLCVHFNHPSGLGDCGIAGLGSSANRLS